MVKVSVVFFGPHKCSRTLPIPSIILKCPLFFDNVPALIGKGYDSRLDLRSRGVIPSDVVVEDVEVRFLSESEVVPALFVGATFKIWEAGVIGIGEVVFLG